jgi:hypothetical protein
MRAAVMPVSFSPKEALPSEWMVADGEITMTELDEDS